MRGPNIRPGWFRVIGVVFLVVAERLWARLVSALGALELCVIGSGRWPVPVDEPGAGRVTLDLVAWPDRGDVSGVVGCSLVESAV